MWSSTFVGSEGRPSLQALHHPSAHHVIDCASDLLHLNGRDLLRLPLDDRRAALVQVVQSDRPYAEPTVRRRKRKISAEGRKRIAEAAKKRWTDWRKQNRPSTTAR